MEEIIEKEIQIKDFIKNQDFIKKLFWNIDMMEQRLSKFKRVAGIFSKSKEEELEYFTYFDALITQLRALCLEHSTRKNNYTVQNLLINLGHEDIAKECDDFLDNLLFNEFETGEYQYKGKDITIRTAIKILADQFICHYDEMSSTDYVLEKMIRVRLSYPDARYNLQNIIQQIIIFIDKGFSKYMKQLKPDM